MAPASRLATLVLALLVTVVSGRAAAHDDGRSVSPPLLTIDGGSGAEASKSFLLLSSVTDGAFGAVGPDRITLLARIMESRWSAEVTVADADAYEPGMADAYDAVIVVATGGTISHQVIDDLVDSDDAVEVVWVGDHTGAVLDQLLGRPDPAGAGPEPGPVPSGVEYRDLVWDAEYLVPAAAAFSNPGPEDRVAVVAEAVGDAGRRIPLIVDVDERFLLLPFGPPGYYAALDSWTSVFLDSLHAGLGHQPDRRRALVRLEDVNPFTYRDPTALRRAYELLEAEQAPFHVALISRYINPETGVDVAVGDEPRFRDLLAQMVGEGDAILVQHGYDHQISGISGIDFEFWESDADQSPEPPQAVDTAVAQARALMTEAGLPIPDIWETPHYALGPADSEAVSALYPLRYEQVPGVGTFHFVVDIGGSSYIPENLGYVTAAEDLARIERMIDYALVLEDPVVSFFWHPWRDISELDHVISILQRRGFEFVSAYDLIGDDSSGAVAHEYFEANYDGLSRVERLSERISDWLPLSLVVLLCLGVLFHLRNSIEIRRSVRSIAESRVPPLPELTDLAAESGRSLPFVQILVPARNEGLVIENTLRRLADLDYPNDCYHVLVVVDERELGDDVAVLTRDVVDRVACDLRPTHDDLISRAEVPVSFDGKVASAPGSTHRADESAPSTKGRALNFGLAWLMRSKQMESLDLIGVFDADARPDREVLREVAFERLTRDPSETELLQGPVLQVSNFGIVSLLGKAAGIELAFHHLTELPRRTRHRKLQFLAGTNYFIGKELLMTVGGWDHESLVEDAELGLRAFTEGGVTATFITSPEIEQTPAGFAIWRRQRERWASGQFQLVGLVRRSDVAWRVKLDVVHNVAVAQFRFLYELAVIAAALGLAVTGGLTGLPGPLAFLPIALFAATVVIWDSYGRVYRNISALVRTRNGPRPDQVDGIGTATGLRPTARRWPALVRTVAVSIRLFVFFPVFILAQPIPRLRAFSKFAAGNSNVGWYKTERTREDIDPCGAPDIAWVSSAPTELSRRPRWHRPPDGFVPWAPWWSVLPMDHTTNVVDPSVRHVLPHGRPRWGRSGRPRELSS